MDVDVSSKSPSESPTKPVKEQETEIRESLLPTKSTEVVPVETSEEAEERW
jgi:hypothetical protein